ncbi:MAG: lysylphosphatidylglycerol synthase transmembrane domain-containing protein [Candidatus Omnitrophota bacterium]
MNIRKKLLAVIAAAALLYLAGCLWTGWDLILQSFKQFRWSVLPFCLALAFLNYIVRFCKWHYYLRLLNIPLRPAASFQVFLSGLTMSATPGKFGEVFKSYLVKQINGTAVSKSAPIVLAERFTDFIALLLMSLMGAAMLPNGGAVFGLCAVIVAAILIAVSWKAAAEKLIVLSRSLPLIGGHSEKLRVSYESIYLLVSPKPLLLTTAISVASWFCECVAFYLVLWGFDAPIPIVPATFIYAFATILGALLMTPGGVGPTEGALGGLLVLLQSVPKGIAASATVIIRLCTLWFAVAVGLTVLGLCSKTFVSLPDDGGFENTIGKERVKS